MSLVERLAEKAADASVHGYVDIAPEERVRWWLNAIADELEAEHMRRHADMDYEGWHAASASWLRARAQGGDE